MFCWKWLEFFPSHTSERRCCAARGRARTTDVAYLPWWIDTSCKQIGVSYRAAHASGLGHSISLGEKRDASRDEANHILFEWLCNAIHCSGLWFIGFSLFAVALGENIVVCRWVEFMFLLFYAGFHHGRRCAELDPHCGCQHVDGLGILCVCLDVAHLPCWIDTSCKQIWASHRVAHFWLVAPHRLHWLLPTAYIWGLVLGAGMLLTWSYNVFLSNTDRQNSQAGEMGWSIF